jgi:uncharacterized membrane protein YoaK (UPF0700 family)
MLQNRAAPTMTADSPRSSRNRDTLGLALLSFAAGATDVLAFLKLGNVFTSAMTGNTALLAIAVSQGNMTAAGRSLTALVGFAVGVALATVVNAAWIGHQDASRDPTRPLLLEILFLVGCTALWSASSEPIEGGVLYAIVSLSALSMGIQAVAARTINVFGISTIVFTTVIIHIVADMTRAASSPANHATSSPSTAFGLATFLAYGCGALMAGILAWQQVRLAIWIPVAGVILALAVWQVAGWRERSAG